MTKEEAKQYSEILRAYSEGKSIQVHYSEGWFPVSITGVTDILNIPIEKLRIKPESKYRPYTNAEEFLKAQKEHGMYIKSQQLDGSYWLVDYITNSGVSWDDVHGDPNFIPYTELTSKCTWQDGTPCGVKEE